MALEQELLQTQILSECYINICQGLIQKHSIQRCKRAGQCHFCFHHDGLGSSLFKIKDGTFLPFRHQHQDGGFSVNHTVLQITVKMSSIKMIYNSRIIQQQ